MVMGGKGVVTVVVVVVVGGGVVVVVVVVGGGEVVVVVVGGGDVVVVVVGGGDVVVVVVGGGGGGLVVVVVGGGVVGFVTTGGADGLDEVVVVTGAAGVPKVKGSVTKEGREVVTCGFVLFPLALLACATRNGKAEGSVEVVGVVVGVVEVLVGAVVGVVPETNGRPLWRGEVVAEAEVLALDPFPMSSALTAPTMTTPAMMMDHRQNVSSPLACSATATPLPPRHYEFSGTPVRWSRRAQLSAPVHDEGRYPAPVRPAAHAPPSEAT